MSSQAILIEVSGKVQGVFFRVSTKKVCDHYGIVGWVKNLPTGNVLMHAQGSVEELNQLKEWCKTGSPMAQVSGIDVKEVAPITIHGFEIRQ